MAKYFRSPEKKKTVLSIVAALTVLQFSEIGNKRVCCEIQLEVANHKVTFL